MAKCIYCKKESILISSPLELCVDCIRNHFNKVKSHIERVHKETRERFGLPQEPPRAKIGIKCNICINQCLIPEGERGYCGVRLNKKGKLVGGKADEGNLNWYYDTLPTNCVADWVCPGRNEYGYKNLAIFFNACSFNCLFCQNWHYREELTKDIRFGPGEIVDAVDDRTTCICYFGGDPTPRLPYAIKTSRLAMEKKKNLRICWETNGSMNFKLLEEMAEISMKSGGCIKFDLKAGDENLNIALCGVTNKQTFSNFKLMAKYVPKRPGCPFLIASTLLVPGYIDEEEVGKIARFIASLNPDIPYSLLGFFPHFFMRDLPTTSGRHAQRCLDAAHKAGLKRVRIANIHLLGDAY